MGKIMNMHKSLSVAMLHSRGATLQLLGRVVRDPLVVFRGQQDLLRAKLVRKSVDDSYLGPAARPPVRKEVHAAASRLRLVASA